MSESVARRVRCRVSVLVAVLIGSAAAGASVSAQDADAWSIQEFVQKRSKWPVLKAALLKLEGRYRVMGEQRMSFVNCDLIFEFDPELRPATTTRDKTVQVNGSLETRKGKLVFVVTRIKDIPSDAARLADQRVRLPPDDSAAWYSLAEWAASRGGFYEDDDLLAGAADLRRSAIQIEYRQTDITDIEPLYALAQKAEQLGLDPAVRDEIMHDAVRRELRAAQKHDVRQRDVALTHALDRLTGANLAVSRDASVIALQAEYEQHPLEVYKQSDADRRQILNRLLYSAAQLERIQLDAADDGRNGFQIARRIEQTLPEFADPKYPDSDEAGRYRELEIAWQLQRLGTLTRDEMLVLSERLEESDRAPRATEVRREWLAAQEPAFRERGSSGLLDFAKEYVVLLEDTDAAARIYMDLYQTSTGRQTAGAELVKLGYQFDGTDWVKSSDAAPDETADAIRLGVVRTGMTANQVRAALGKPTSVVKFAVRDLVSELWVYEEHGVAIELRRRGTEGESIAREISDLNARRAQ